MLSHRLRTTLSRAIVPRASPSRIHPFRLYTTPTRPVSEPAVQHAEAARSDDLPPFLQNNSSPYSPPHSSSEDPIHRRSDPILNVPSPLPPDIVTPSSAPQASLYPSSGVLDAISMISICLRRQEHIPRAYQIFRQLIEDAETGTRSYPNADVWGRVIEGAATMAKRPESSGVEESEEDRRRNERMRNSWRTRVQDMVAQWESTMGAERIAGRAELRDGGIKVYQGWFSGLVKAQLSLEPLLPYLHVSEGSASDAIPGKITAYDLLEAIKPSDMPLACEALLDAANRFSVAGLAAQVVKIQRQEQERRERMAREQAPEVKPVLEGDGKGLRESDQLSDMADLAEQAKPRFGVTNLRSALGPIATASLPVNRQRALETASLAAAQEELRHSHEQMRSVQGTDPFLNREQLQGWMHTWTQDLTEVLQKSIHELRDKVEAPGYIDKRTLNNASRAMTEGDLLMYLSLLPAEKLSLVTVLEVMRNVGSGGVVDGLKALRAMHVVGKAVEAEYRAETIRNVAGLDSPAWLRTIDPTTQKPSRKLVSNVWRKIGEQVANTPTDTPVLAKEDWLPYWTPPWTQNVHLEIGAFLVGRLLEATTVERRKTVDGEEYRETQPAFAHVYEYVRGFKLGVLRLNPAVAARLGTDNIASFVPPKALPMLVEPRKWKSDREGGYLLHNVPIMRLKESLEQRLYLNYASEEGHLEPVFHGLDVLSSTPWKINRQVFDIVLAVWNRGDGIADIPSSSDKADYDLPPRPSHEERDLGIRQQYHDRIRAATLQQKKDHAERCKFNYVLEVARSFINDTFYLPHNMDFRGRAYPIPPHLSPVGDDLCRGLLTFGEKKPLGRKGLKWLQIHLANVYGYDKMSFEERAQFSVNHEKDIFDSADHPLDGHKWWLKAEDPWQCLATCFDLAAALRSPNPEEYESSLPVHQDGTCNGMQHYAALGGDVRGAKAVNLENGDRPADIYTGVADIVNRIIDEDKKRGVPIAKLFKEPLGRKVVKQTVMTTVYGVTFIGARDQIAKQLASRTDLPSEHIFTASTYVAKTVLGCIGDLFRGAKDIMDWLSTSARLISRSVQEDRIEQALLTLAPPSKGKAAAAASSTAKTNRKTRMKRELMSAVVWTTPLGLPVVQPYRKAVKKQIMTSLQSVFIADPAQPAMVSPQKQATAFPPNFIHSLDATHMLMTALACKQNGITFASVHDSYWTHASSIDDMSELIRAQFIELHSENLIADLRQEFIDRYGESLIPVTFAKKILKASQVRKMKEDERRRKISEALATTDPEALAEAAQEARDAIDDNGKTKGLSSVLKAMDADADSATADITEDDLDEDDDVISLPGMMTGLTEKETNRLLEEMKFEFPYKIEKFGGTQFVRFKDLIPAQPPRGEFDVQKIKESTYFFS